MSLLFLDTANSKYSTQVLADTPALYWKLEDPSGIIAPVDSSGNGRNASINGTLSPGLGQAAIYPSLGTAAGLNGTGNNNYIYRPYDSALDVGTGDFTFEFLVLSNNVLSNYVEIVARDDSASGNGVTVYLQVTSGALRIWIGGSLFVGTRRISDGVPHHILISRISGSVVIYVDGSVEASGSAPGSINVSSGIRVGVVSAAYPTLTGEAGHIAWYTHGITSARARVHYAQIGSLLNFSADGYIYENVGFHVTNTQEADAYIYESVGYSVVNTKVGVVYIYENVGITSPNHKEADGYVYEDPEPLTMKSSIGIPI